jgi:hypothetical protein
MAYTVTGTSGLPNEEQGLATGLTSMTQQVGIMIGIPILSAIAATQSVELTGIHLALSVNVVVTSALASSGSDCTRAVRTARPHRYRRRPEERGHGFGVIHRPRKC